MLYLIILILSSCGKSPKSKLDPQKTYVSLTKVSPNNAPAPCDSCLIVEVNDYSLVAILSNTNPSVETCNGTARYISDFNNKLLFPENTGQQIVWTLSKTQGVNDPECFPGTLELYVIKEENNLYTFLFANNLNEYIMSNSQKK